MSGGQWGERLTALARDIRDTIADAPDRYWRFAVLALALVGGIAVWTIATQVFPYHSLNHDEGVYLQQAAMLLDGKLFLQPPVPEAFRPWFFVESASGMYPKYSPVPAAMFAPFLALGVPRVALALIGAGIVTLVIGIGAELFDRPTGLLAGVVLLASPLYLLNTAVFLPYAPTTLLNCVFALAYLRADRTGSRRMATVAGVAIALAFFTRQYTAFLFGLPFVLHALWTLRTRESEVMVRQGIVAALGLVGVAVTLGYNAIVTGSLLEFPYHAFAPRDGIGFGVHELLDREVDYTPRLAARANARVLDAFAARWMVGGFLGTILAVVGVAIALRRWTARRLALAGVVVTVILGELYFWGTLNMIGDIEEIGDGLIAYLGPYYHFDLLVPAAIFAGLALRTGAKQVGALLTARLPRRRALAVGVALLAVGATVGGTAAVSTAEERIETNQEITDHYEVAYQPFDATSFSNALVLLPDPYGPWLNHPFQPLRNDPSYEGDIVYALEERPFDVVEAFPDRTLYRYSFRGGWAPVVGDPVEPHLERIQALEGKRIRLNATAGIPQYAELVSVRVKSDGGTNATTVVDPEERLVVSLDVERDRATLTGPAIEEPLTVPVGGQDTIRTQLFVDYGTGAGFSYGLALPVEPRADDVAVLSPRLELCTVPHRCGGEATYVPSATRPGQSLNTTLEVRE
jgi:hypothetical protein